MARISVDRGLMKPQDFASDGSDAVGFTHFWGNSPALDLLKDDQAAAFGPLAIGTSPSGIYKDDEKEKENEEEDADDSEPIGVIVEDKDKVRSDPVVAPLPNDSDSPINILVVGGCDVRHLLKSLARRRRWTQPGQKIRFFLHETKHEVLARHLLFLQIFANSALPVRERMELFLSIYGNTLVRERDSTYVEDIAKEFIELITENSTHPLAEIVNLEHLKYKDRDAMQEVVKGWMKDVPFDVEALREQRCRGYYRERFDFRKNQMDYDYQTHIKQRAGIINWFHYKEFGHTGVAFETRLASYNISNRTLASYTEATDSSKGTTVQVRGFWGDIINSPYHAFCTSTDAQDRPRLFKISGSQYRHTECDVAEFNVTAYLSEMETGEKYHLPAERPEEETFPYASPLDGMRGEEDSASGMRFQEVEEEASEGGYSTSAAPVSKSRRERGKKKVEWPALAPGFDNVEVVLMAGPLSETLKKPKYKGLFHRAFVGSFAVMPIIEEMNLLKGGDACFHEGEDCKVKKPPRLQAPDMLGKMKDESCLALALAPGAEVIFETLKYQAHFDGRTRVAFRHRIAQVGHLAGWCMADERRALPRLEDDMKERRANELEKDATDFLRFVTPSC